MGKTIDENQLKKVLRFKIQIDPLLDSQSGENKDIDINTIDSATIHELVNYMPVESERTQSPFSGKNIGKSDFNYKTGNFQFM